jgi:hypothetical protein
MFNLGQLTHLPPYLASNPFHPLLVKFSRTKFGSYESLFLLEKYLIRYSWLALLVLFALVLPPLEEYWGISTMVRLSTLLFPCFFLWSLTRLAGVELMQLVLEGHWTAEFLALPLSNRAWIDGFVTPLWVVFRQYALITMFSLALYGLETQTVMINLSLPGQPAEYEYFWGDYLRVTGFLAVTFFTAALWIAFVYLARLYTEIRLRNGLLKGLATLFLFMAGGLLFTLYLVIFLRYRHWMDSNLILIALGGLALLLLLGAIYIHRKLLAHFRDYLATQIDLDMVIYDDGDPHTSAWTPIG